MTIEAEMETAETAETPNSDSVWSRFKQDQAGAIEKVVGIAIVVMITIAAMGAVGAAIKVWTDNIPEPGEAETGF